VLIIVIIGIYMYVNNSPPFFDKNLDCMIGGINGPIIYNTSNCDINSPPETPTTVSYAPMRYLFPIIDANNNPNLCQILISIYGNSTNNNGYNCQIADTIQANMNRYINNSLYSTILTGIPGLLVQQLDTCNNGGYNYPDDVLVTPPLTADQKSCTVSPGLPVLVPTEYRTDLGNQGNPADDNKYGAAAGSCTPGFIQWAPFEVVRSSAGKGTNGYGDSQHGFTSPTYNQLSNCPQTAYIPGVITTTNYPRSSLLAKFNYTALYNWFYDTSQQSDTLLQRQMLTRFVLCSMINDAYGQEVIPLNIYMSPNEFVTFTIDGSGADTSGFTFSTPIQVNQLPLPLSNYPIIHYISDNKNAGCSGTDFNLPCKESTGTLNGQVGSVINNRYRFHKYVRIILWALLGLFVLYIMLRVIF